jgi:ParB family chromosome partitioning protein
VSSPRRVGLPESLRMRHDNHFVEQLGRPSGEPVGRFIPVKDIDANPHQPRQVMGDISDLTASIREKGVLEPILVRRHGGRYQIVAGERRYRAAIQAGLVELPCVVHDVGEAEVMELALLENLQRKDLTPFEEAEGLKSLADNHAYTHERMAEILGKSRSSITETLSLASMPEVVREQCRLADIQSKSLLLQVVRQSTPQKMSDLIERLKTEGTTRVHARRLARSDRGKASRGRPRSFTFRHQAKDKSFTIALKFKKSQASCTKDDVVRALQAILEELKRED